MSQPENYLTYRQLLLYCSWLLFLTDWFGLGWLVPPSLPGTSSMGRTRGSHLDNQHGHQLQLLFALKRVPPSNPKNLGLQPQVGHDETANIWTGFVPVTSGVTLFSWKLGTSDSQILCVTLCCSLDQRTKRETPQKNENEVHLCEMRTGVLVCVCGGGCRCNPRRLCLLDSKCHAWFSSTCPTFSSIWSFTVF